MSSLGKECRSMANFETEWELEQELESGSGEGEGILGAIGNVLGGLLGEEELEQHETAHEFENPEMTHEFESHELAHEFEHPESTHEFETHEFEHPESSHEFEQHEFELETGEQFFGKIFKGIRGLVRRAAPLLKRIASVAVPIV